MITFRLSPLALATIVWRHILCMNSVALAEPIMFARRSNSLRQFIAPETLLYPSRLLKVRPIFDCAFATAARSRTSRPSHLTQRSGGYVCEPGANKHQFTFSPRNTQHLQSRTLTSFIPAHPNKDDAPKSTNIESNQLRQSESEHELHDNISEINEENWRSFSDLLTETLELPSISVPAEHVHWLLSNTQSPLKPFLALTMNELEGIHPRIKVVRDSEELSTDSSGSDGNQHRKRILLNSQITTGNDSEASSIDFDAADNISKLVQLYPGIPKGILQTLADEFDAAPGNTEIIQIAYQNQPVNRILSKLLPPEAQPPPSSYEQIGHVAHFNLRSNHVPYGRLIGSVMLDRLKPSIRTVVNKVGEVGGPYRTYQMDLLAGDDDYYVQVNEHGSSLFFDLRNVYWCTRLEGERTYTIENEFKPNQLIADAFCGVGALCIRAALAKGCRIMANDLNPDAVTYCEDSAKKNGIDVSRSETFSVQCGDAREFIMNLGMLDTSNLPHHLILNFPLGSPSFLNALRWWPSGEKLAEPPRVHLYTFARGDGDSDIVDGVEKENSTRLRTAAEVAVDMVADGLLPEGGYIEPSKFRGEYLNELGCKVEAREIRDAAPGKLVICVSFSVSRLLLRRMQGDYGLD